jgi:hypothetical protein
MKKTLAQAQSPEFKLHSPLTSPFPKKRPLLVVEARRQSIALVPQLENVCWVTKCFATKQNTNAMYIFKYRICGQ